MAKKSRLTEQQQAFIAEYLQSFNAVQAAIKVGYAPTSARANANRLVSKLASHITKALNVRMEKIDLSRDNLIMELRIHMMRCAGQIPVKVTEKRKLESGEEVWEELDKYVFDANGFNKAVETMAKMFRLTDTKMEINVNKREMGVLVVPELKKDEEKDVTPKPEALEMKMEAPVFPPLFKDPVPVEVKKDDEAVDVGKSV